MLTCAKQCLSQTKGLYDEAITRDQVGILYGSLSSHVFLPWFESYFRSGPCTVYRFKGESGANIFKVMIPCYTMITTLKCIFLWYLSYNYTYINIFFFFYFVFRSAWCNLQELGAFDNYFSLWEITLAREGPTINQAAPNIHLPVEGSALLSQIWQQETQRILSLSNTYTPLIVSMRRQKKGYWIHQVQKAK